MPCGFTTPLSCELRRLGFSLPLHCSALFNHGQVTPFIVYIAAFGRFMRRSRIPKHSRRHIYSRCEVRSCGAGMHRSAAEGRFGVAEPVGRASVCARAQTIGVEFRAVTFRTRVYSWTRRTLICEGHGWLFFAVLGIIRTHIAQGTPLMDTMLYPGTGARSAACSIHRPRLRRRWRG